MVDAVFDRLPAIPIGYAHILAGAGDPTYEIAAGVLIGVGVATPMGAPSY
jgi:hypothetical protein